MVGHSECCEHLGAGLDHHRRSAQVKLGLGRVFMSGEVLFERHLVDESGEPRPFVLRQGRRERGMEREVRVRLLQLHEVILVEEFLS